MEYQSLAGIPAASSRIVQGTIMLSPDDQDAANALLDAVYEHGGRTFDTAHGYGRGMCETALGVWINDRGVRDEVVILGKGAHPYDGKVRVTPEDITSDLHESLEHMHVDVIDLYLLHRDDRDVPVGPIVEVLNRHQQDGKIRRFGGSNWYTDRIAEANEYAAAHNLNPFTASSPNYSLAEQAEPPWEGCISIGGDEGAGERAWYIDQGMPVFPWSSLGRGFFSGRFTRENAESFTDAPDQLVLKSYATDDNFTRLDRVRELADRYDATIAQVALAFVLDGPMETFPLVGCQTGAEFEANAKALDLKLSPDESSWVDLKSDERPW
jgi:aryl-alcohol dehydrogenase-like predicted oxidoreductase